MNEAHMRRWLQDFHTGNSGRRAPLTSLSLLRSDTEVGQWMLQLRTDGLSMQGISALLAERHPTMTGRTFQRVHIWFESVDLANGHSRRTEPTRMSRRKRKQTK